MFRVSRGRRSRPGLLTTSRAGWRSIIRGSLEIDWDGYDASLLGPLLPHLHPFANEDLLVEANIPYMDWFRAAKRGTGSDLRWLLSKIDCAERFEQAKIFVRWRLGESRATRTNGRLPGRRKFFYHDSPVIRRADVSLAAELESPALAIEKLSRAEGEEMLDFARETSAMRYRELHGFTYGDRVTRAARRSGPRRAGVRFGRAARASSALARLSRRDVLQERVPIGYIECLTLFERMEVGFNLYYTFREGETGVALRPAAAALQPAAAGDLLHRGPLSTGSAQRRSHRVRRVLVLSQTRIPARESGRGQALADGRGQAARQCRVSHAGTDAQKVSRKVR